MKEKVLADIPVEDLRYLDPGLPDWAMAGRYIGKEEDICGVQIRLRTRPGKNAREVLSGKRIKVVLVDE